MAKAPTVVSTKLSSAQSTAEALLAKLDPMTVLCIGDPAKLQERLAQVSAVFSDVDGTLVDEGHTILAPDYIERIRKLSSVGVATVLVTGKPYAEISKLLKSLPAGLPLEIIYEKGAYYLSPDASGKLQKRYLLSTPELESAVHKLRQQLLTQKPHIESKYLDHNGTPMVSLGWGGTGTHTSVLSIDILQDNPPSNYLELVGSERDALKVHDPSLLAQVEADLQEFVDRYSPGWQLVHLGNGNSEITPGPIEKDDAIRKLLALPGFVHSKQVLLLGDSGNDQKMFALRHTIPAVAGLVLHREKSLPLVDAVDYVAFGMANAHPLLDWLLAAKKE